jgi:hypothetical protein
MKTIKMSLAAMLAVTLSLASSSSFALQKVDTGGGCVSVTDSRGEIITTMCTISGGGGGGGGAPGGGGEEGSTITYSGYLDPSTGVWHENTTYGVSSSRTNKALYHCRRNPDSDLCYGWGPRI